MKTSRPMLLSIGKFPQKADGVKITLSLIKVSIDCFKKETEKREACYQVIISNLIHEYVKYCLNINKK